MDLEEILVGRGGLSHGRGLARVQDGFDDGVSKEICKEWKD